MFGSKPSPTPPSAEAPFDTEGYSQVYEYLAVAYFGIGAFNKEANLMARKGWELVNGAMAGTVHYGYFRRRLKGDPAE